MRPGRSQPVRELPERLGRNTQFKTVLLTLLTVLRQKILGPNRYFIIELTHIR